MNAKVVMCWLGLLAGTAVSVVANVEHMNGPAVAKVLGASVPVLMAFAVHLTERVSNKLAMGVAWLAVLLAFLVSYQSTYFLVKSWGMTEFQAALFPLVPECVMIVALMGLTEEIKQREQTGQKTVPPRPSTIRVAPSPVPQRTAVAHALSSDPKLAVLSAAPVEDKPAKPVLSSGDNEARLSAARQIADDLGDSLCRARLVEELGKQGFKISTNAAAALTRELKASRS